MKNNSTSDNTAKDETNGSPYEIPTSVVKTSREELNNITLHIKKFDIREHSELKLIEDDNPALPEDLTGYYFIAAALSPEGTQVINGDGMLYRVHFEKGKATLKSRIAKTPCYYADQITQRSDQYPRSYQFRDAGPSRSSPRLGNRNQLNTAFLQTTRHFIVTFDAGIPWVLDPATMELIEPIGRLDQWLSVAAPFSDLVSFIRQPIILGMQQVRNLGSSPRLFIFPPHSNPAHPVSDHHKTENSCPNSTDRKSEDTTKEHLFTLNYSVGYKGKFRKRFDQFLAWVIQFIFWLNCPWIRRAVSLMRRANPDPVNSSGRINLPRVYGFTDLIRYTFSGRQIERWQLDLPDENPNSEKLVIGEQSIHQMVVTDKYIILADIAFKIEYSQLFSPFHIGRIENCIDNLLKYLKRLINQIFPEMTNCIKILWEKISGKIFRTGYWLYAWLLKPLTPSQVTNFYIVRRSDLDTIHSTRDTRPGSSNVVPVRKVTIPREVSHFTADYSNPGIR